MEKGEQGAGEGGAFGAEIVDKITEKAEPENVDKTRIR